MTAGETLTTIGSQQFRCRTHRLKMAINYNEAAVDSISILVSGILSRNTGEINEQEKAKAILEAHDIYKQIRNIVHAKEDSDARKILEEKAGPKYQVFIS